MAEQPTPGQYRGPGWYRTHYADGTPRKASHSVNRSNPVDVRVETKSLEPHYRGSSVPSGASSHPTSPDKIRQMQAFLNSKGYKIPVDGVWGHLTDSAVNNWHKGTGVRDPKAWTAKNIQPQTGTASSGQTATTPTTTPATATTAGTATSPYNFDPSQYNPNVGSTIGAGDLGPGAQTVDVNKGAAAAAGLEFDPQIHTQQVAQQRVAPDTAQHLADIKNWYGQVQKSLGTANTRNQEMFSGASNSQAQVAKDILSSLGGNANLAAGVVGQAGADAANTTQQMGNAQQAYQNDLAPIFQMQQAGASSAENARQSQVANTIMNQIASLQGQKGQSEATHRLDLVNQNNSVLNNRQANTLSRLQYNNNLGQQQFGNSLSLAQTAAAAAMQNAQINNINASTKATNQGLQTAQGFIPWAKLNAGQRDTVIQHAVATITDPSTGAMLPKMDDLSAWQRARQYMLGQGYTSAHATGNGALAGRIPDMNAHNQIQNMLQVAIAKAKGLSGQSGV